MRLPILFLCCASVGAAGPLTLAQNQTLRIRFTGPTPICTPSPCTRIQVDFGSLSTTIPAPNFNTTSQIFNGNALLGQETGVGISVLFVSPLSNFPNPSIRIDFTSILNGTIDGRIEVTAGSAYTINDVSAVRVLVGTDSSTGGSMPISSISVVYPSVTGIAPVSVTQGNSGFLITVTGTAFAPGDSITVNDSFIPTTYVNPTTLTGTVPARLLVNAGQLPVAIRDPANNASNQVLLTIVPPPSIVSATPQNVDAGSPGFTMTVSGSRFVPGCTVRVGGSVLPASYVSANQLTVLVPAAVLTNAGRFNVAVAAPDGVLSNNAAFIVAPVLTSLGNVQVSGNQVTIDATGIGFTPASFLALTANGIQLSLPTTLISSSGLRATMTSPALLAGGGAVNVTEADGASSRFLVFSLPFGISFFTPGGVMAGGPSFTLVISGGVFPPGTVALWNGAPLTTTVSGLNQLTASVPASLIASPGTATVQVVHPNGSTYSAPFTINAGLSILSLSPNSAVAGASGFNLAISGGGFVSGAVVQWNGTSLQTTFLSSTQLIAAVPANLIGQAGVAAIGVVNPGGVLSNAVPFAISPALAVPAISGLAPGGALAGSPNLVVTATGSGFTADSIVLFNGLPLATTFVDATHLVATVPAAMLAVAGGATVSVRAGSNVSGGVSFGILSGPPATSAAAIVNLGNPNAAIAPGSLISIYGAGLAAGVASASGTPLPNSLAGVSVEVNGIPAPLLYVSPTQINAQIPFEAPPGYGTLVVDVSGAARTAVVIQLAPIAPGVWTIPGGSYALAINASDGSIGAPVAPGAYVTVYLTGQGALNNAVPTGGAATSSPLATPAGTVEASVGGVAANVAGAMAPGLVGILQVNFQVPATAPGDQPLIVSIGGVPSNVTLLPIANP